MRAQNLFLILYDRVLVSQDPRLIAQQLRQQILVPKNSLLVAHDHPLVGDDRILFPDSRLRHYGVPGDFLVVTDISGNKNGDGRYLRASRFSPG